MNGQSFKFSRRDVIRIGVVATAAAAAYPLFRSSQKQVLPVIDENSKYGHAVRDTFQVGTPTTTQKIKTLIIGSGISGLSTAYFLEIKGSKDYLILEADTRVGGNSAFDQNELSAFPLGAHYLPIARNEDIHLLNFLKDIGVVEGYQNGLPIYNDEYLCHAPTDRIFVKGRWQEGGIPTYAASEQELSELKAFLAHVEELRQKKGKDGHFVFSIPVEYSSKDPEWLKLDQISFREYLDQKNWKSDYLAWYVNYCCRDDFGLESNLTSAWAGLHYFSSRNGRAANAEPQSVLTWPEGNGFLARKLHDKLSQKVQTKSLVRKVLPQKVGFDVYYTDENQNQHLVQCEHVVYAIPKAVVKFIQTDLQFPHKSDSHPWVVATLAVTKSVLENRMDLCWDNIRYGSESLGYVNATHQLLTQNSEHVNITFYHAFSTGIGHEQRKSVSQLSDQDLKSIVFSELSKMHPDIEKHTKSIQIKVWGHGMIAPKPNYIWNERLANIQAEPRNIHFAHTERSGISIFEEAFHQGHMASRKIL